MELTKADKRQLHDLIKRGDFKDCRPEIQEKVRQWLGMEN